MHLLTSNLYHLRTYLLRLCSYGSRSCTVFGNIDDIRFSNFNYLKCSLEIIHSLGWEPNNHISCDGHLRNFAPKCFDRVNEYFPGMTSFHFPKNNIAAALYWNMQKLKDPVAFYEDLYQPLTHVREKRRIHHADSNLIISLYANTRFKEFNQI